MHLLTNEFKRDLNETRVIAVFNLFITCLRLKKEMRMHCERFDAPLFLNQDERKTSAEIEAFLNSASKLTAIFQNGKKINSCCRPVMRKMLHDGL